MRLDCVCASCEDRQFPPRLRLCWARLALADFEQAHDYIAEEDPEAARQVAQRILDATKILLKHPYIGRVGEDEDTRE